ncbi:hypothetical protein [Neobacillus niacini]|uniref:hypothetical protein n=1 Tax=Neobacillus niacini TaxID=86668 RepID=UPI00285AC498|nr:hypothetical protein [Neobacillus niacini]MDR6997787.1 hypothetical protein [Neobacillus niacini]
MELTNEKANKLGEAGNKMPEVDNIWEEAANIHEKVANKVVRRPRGNKYHRYCFEKWYFVKNRLYFYPILDLYFYFYFKKGFWKIKYPMWQISR